MVKHLNSKVHTLATRALVSYPGSGNTWIRYLIGFYHDDDNDTMMTMIMMTMIMMTMMMMTIMMMMMTKSRAGSLLLAGLFPTTRGNI